MPVAVKGGIGEGTPDLPARSNAISAKQTVSELRVGNVRSLFVFKTGRKKHGVGPRCRTKFWNWQRGE
jgi:hypothetical protein